MDVDALAVKAEGSIADNARKERRDNGVDGMGESYFRMKWISADLIGRTVVSLTHHRFTHLSRWGLPNSRFMTLGGWKGRSRGGLTRLGVIYDPGDLMSLIKARKQHNRKAMLSTVTTANA